MSVAKYQLPGQASLSAATTGTGTAFSLNDCRQYSWASIASGTVSGGTVVIECAPASDYAGTWFLLDTITAANISAGTEGTSTTPAVMGGWVRARVTSNVTGGGNITVYINGLLD